ncbi:tRNA-specific adenosine deaminase [Thalassobaculum fulvum]|jgi:tRNA(Arg) A34 adenosine deaminase TadA|uniref:tRNA-specific adenosine deaminase n=1 Tax=Thalassobaculum fulvum TaxID=1633335 RepID=A0A919CN63_9PROT|nr:nucleoside deaminase [Thalassobaculum fulvum]GHD43325.1 tRNA-specific adenosine deaminase [Thalassobaculum fulvum]
MTDETFLRRAIELSRGNAVSAEGGPFGAVVVRDGEIVGEGVNRVTTDQDPTAHAEMVAIREACARLGTHDLSGAVVYTSCEPCPMCLTAILWARIDRMVYANTRADAAEIGFDDAWFYEQVALPIGERALPAVNLLRDEARAVFRQWYENPDKNPY